MTTRIHSLRESASYTPFKSVPSMVTAPEHCDAF